MVSVSTIKKDCLFCWLSYNQGASGRKCDEMKKLENKKDQLSYEELVEENKILNLLIDTQKQTIDINSKTIKILFQALRIL